MNATVAQYKSYPFGVNTTIELKKYNDYIRQQRNLSGYVSTKNCAGVVECNCYISDLNRGY